MIKALKLRLQLTTVFWGHSTSCFIYGVAFQITSEKKLYRKILQAIWDAILYESNCKCDLYKLKYKIAFISFFSVHDNQKQEPKRNFGPMKLNSYACFVHNTIFFNIPPPSKLLIFWPKLPLIDTAQHPLIKSLHFAIYWKFLIKMMIHEIVSWNFWDNKDNL